MHWQKYLIKEKKQLETERQVHEPEWRELKKYFWPESGRFDTGSARTQPTIDRSAIKNSVASQALFTAAAGLMAGVTSPASVWMRFGSEEIQREKFGKHREWMDMASQSVLNIYRQSNFYQVLPSAYAEAILYGNASMFQVEDKKTVARFVPATAGEYYIGMSSRLEVDTIYREFYMTVNQMVGRFGLDRLSKACKEKEKKNQGHDWVRVVHVVRPNNKNLPAGARPAFEFPFASIYFEPNNKMVADRPLSVSGYNTFPAAVLQWDLISTDPYGTGLGAQALSDTKELQFWIANRMEGVHLMSKPGWKAPTTLRGSIQSQPDGVTYFDPTLGGDSITPLHLFNYPTDHVSLIIEQKQDEIRKIFKNDLFRSILDSDRRQTTAAEIHEKKEEKLLNLGPALERIEGWLDTTIDRTLDIAVRMEIIPPPPPDLQGQPLKVEYLGFLSQAQRAVGTATIDRAYEFTAGVAQAKGDLSPWDILNTDEGQRDYYDMLGLPADQVVDNDGVQAVREQRAQQQQAAQTMGVIDAGAQTAKTLADTSIEGETALRAALDRMGAQI